jgi:hypothetical protein
MVANGSLDRVSIIKPMHFIFTRFTIAAYHCNPAWNLANNNVEKVCFSSRNARGRTTLSCVYQSQQNLIFVKLLLGDKKYVADIYCMILEVIYWEWIRA